MATRPLVGGQAVMEGVMMRSPKSFAVAVRKTDGSIVVRERAWLSFGEHFPMLKWPLLRGANMLIESMYNGLQALQFSAEQAMESEQNKKATSKDAKQVDWVLLGTMGVSLLFGLALFKGVPHLTAFLIGEWFAVDGQSALPVTSVGFHLVDGAVKMCLFVGYILGISFFPDVKRLFMYHGAEHKVVHTFEKQLPLEVEHAEKQPTAHPRCGTSLILLVVAISIVVFAALIPFMPQVSEVGWLQSLFALVVKVPLMLPVAGIAYEFQRAAAKYPNNALIRCLIAPGMWMQRLTTREPQPEQLEIALVALRKNLWRENQDSQTENQQDHLEAFANFEQAKQILVV